MTKTITIEIDQENYQFLQGIATPLVDTANMAIKKLIKNYLSLTLPPNNPVDDADNNFRHTKIIEASINDQYIAKPTWNQLLIMVVGEALKTLTQKQIIEVTTGIEIGQVSRQGKGTKNCNFKYIPELGLSFQSKSADNVWEMIKRITKATNIKVTAEILYGDRSQVSGNRIIINN